MFRTSVIDRLFPLLFSPEEGGGIGDVSNIPHGESGDMEILERGSEDEGEGEEEEPEEEGQGEEETFESGEEEEGEGEEEGEEEEKDEEEEEEGDKDLEVFQGRPALTDIKKKYPKIFKEFPELREVLFREQEASKRFGTVEEMDDAVSKVQNFDTIEAALLGGDTSPIIEQLGKNAPESLALLADNFLPTLLKKSQDLYLRATIPVVEQVLWSAYQHGKSTNQPNLMKSAMWVSQHVFGKAEIPDPSRHRTTGPHPAEKQLEEERQRWTETRFKEASSEISQGIDVELDSEIAKGLDPGKNFSKRQRAKLMEDIKDEIDATLQKDQAFQRQMKALWQKASSADYPRDQRASIKSAFLARAKALVPSVRARLRAEWLGQQLPKSGGKGDEQNKNKEQPNSKKRDIPSGGRAASGGGPKTPPTPRDVDYTKTSDMDLIEGRFHRKK